MFFSTYSTFDARRSSSPIAKLQSNCKHHRQAAARSIFITYSLIFQKECENVRSCLGNRPGAKQLEQNTGRVHSTVVTCMQSLGSYTLSNASLRVRKCGPSKLEALYLLMTSLLGLLMKHQSFSAPILAAQLVCMLTYWFKYTKTKVLELHFYELRGATLA